MLPHALGRLQSDRERTVDESFGSKPVRDWDSSPARRHELGHGQVALREPRPEAERTIQTGQLLCQPAGRRLLLEADDDGVVVNGYSTDREFVDEVLRIVSLYQSFEISLEGRHAGKLTERHNVGPDEPAPLYYAKAVTYRSR